MKSFQLANSAFYSGIVLRTIFGFLPFWLIFFVVETMKNFLHLSIAFFNVSMIIQTSFILNHEWVHKYTDEVSTIYTTLIFIWIDKLQLCIMNFFNLGNIEDHPVCCCRRVNAHRNSWLYFGKIHHNPIKWNIVLRWQVVTCRCFLAGHLQHISVGLVCSINLIKDQVQSWGNKIKVSCGWLFQDDPWRNVDQIF